VALECEVMGHVASHGYPVPRVHSGRGVDIVMERVGGPTMLEDLARRPWLVRHHADLLARLHQELHSLPGLDGLPARLGTGQAILHLDLHPGNVILGRAGPVVIDWSNAARGEGLADVADTWLILSAARVPGSPLRRALGNALRRRFAARFGGHFEMPLVRRQLAAAAERRLRDPNLHPDERARIRLLAESPASAG
jgi:aminoglycoside phosphotransferase (APT) family kinase protein